MYYYYHDYTVFYAGFKWIPFLLRKQTFNLKNISYLFIYLFIKTYLYSVDIISNQAIFHNDLWWFCYMITNSQLYNI